MKDDAHRMAMTRAHAADAVPEIDPVDAACALDWTVVDGEDDSIPLPKRHDLGPRLHARALLGEHEARASHSAGVTSRSRVEQPRASSSSATRPQSTDVARCATALTGPLASAL
jgi:hypothetical protein